MTFQVCKHFRQRAVHLTPILAKNPFLPMNLKFQFITSMLNALRRSGGGLH
jgi:hypothetical protein